MSKTVTKKKAPQKIAKVVTKKKGNVSKMKSPAKSVYPAWTHPKHLSKNDHQDLKNFYDLFNAGKIISAFSIASNFDTIVREAIPPEIWAQRYGSSTSTGEEGLKEVQNKEEAQPSPTQNNDAESQAEPIEIKFSSVQELEQLVMVNSKNLFGEQALFFMDKTENRDDHFPDKFLIDFSNNEKPKLYLIEMVLADQNFGQYFVRTTHFFAILKNRDSQNDLIWNLQRIINLHKLQGKELLREIPDDLDLTEFLSSLLDNRPIVLLITDGEKSELPLLAETYTETWGRILKTYIIRRYSREGEEQYPVASPFSDLLKNEKSKSGAVKCTEEDHLIATSETSRNIYNEIKTALLQADSSIEFNAKKIYISLRKGKNLAFFHLRRKISLVVMNPEDDTRKQIKHHEIKSLPASVQKFWNGPSCTIVIENSENLVEVINLMKKLIAKA
jgi:predicted transport protein